MERYIDYKATSRELSQCGLTEIEIKLMLGNLQKLNALMNQTFQRES